MHLGLSVPQQWDCRLDLHARKLPFLPSLLNKPDGQQGHLISENHTQALVSPI